MRAMTVLLDPEALERESHRMGIALSLLRSAARRRARADARPAPPAAYGWHEPAPADDSVAEPRRDGSWE
jgi:hypothetical protein